MSKTNEPGGNINSHTAPPRTHLCHGDDSQDITTTRSTKTSPPPKPYNLPMQHHRFRETHTSPLELLNLSTRSPNGNKRHRPRSALSHANCLTQTYHVLAMPIINLHKQSSQPQPPPQASFTRTRDSQTPSEPVIRHPYILHFRVIP